MPTSKKVPAKKSKKVIHPKMDRLLVSLKQPWEPKDMVRWFKKKFGKTGFKINQTMVKDAVKLVGRSQKKVKQYLTDTHGPRKVEGAESHALYLKKPKQ